MCRYFVLYHHGGIYIDCDLVCKRSFASLLNIKGALLPATDIGLSNDLIVAPPKHHLLELAAFSLHAWSDYKLLPVRLFFLFAYMLEFCIMIAEE